jgi:1-acyl-sn-glycerol-3-phosphate acyltransferase
MANHQSALDIPLLMSVLPAEWKTVFWAKKSLFKIPVLGWAMRTLGHMPIDRVDLSTAGRTLFQSRRRISDARSLLVFPEATYAPEGETLPYKRGGFVLAIKTGLPILPVGVWGTRVALPPNGRLITRTAVTVRFGSPIPTAERTVSARAELTEQTRKVIEDLAQPPTAG